MKKKLTLRYYSVSRTRTDAYETEAETARDLLHEVQEGDHILLTTHVVRAAINGTLSEWDTVLKDGDEVTLMPPFSGG